MLRTLAFRLTFLYGILFFIFSTGIYFWTTQTFSKLHMQQLDSRLHDEMMELREDYLEEGIRELQESFIEEGEAQGNELMFLRMMDPNQNNLVSSDLTAWQDLSISPSGFNDLVPGEERWSTNKLSGHKTAVRVLTVKMRDGNILQLGIVMGEVGKLLVEFNRVLLASLGIMILLGSLAGGWIVHSAMRGVRRVTETAMQIGEHDLESRVPIQNKGEEIDRLANAFNSMLNRIASLVQGLKEVSDNIAHDLKRPVTRIRGIAEIILTQPETSEEKREAIGLIIEECDQLIGTVNTMLEIARLDATGEKDPRQEVNLTSLCQNAAELFSQVAEDRNIQIVVDVPRNPVIIKGEPGQLQRALSNLLDNALLYAKGGKITLSLSSQGTTCAITVADEGPGISPELQKRIFERFFRGDPSRSEPGTGLGLNLVKAIVVAHGGKVELESSPGNGSRFSMRFPVH